MKQKHCDPLTLSQSTTRRTPRINSSASNWSSTRRKDPLRKAQHLVRPRRMRRTAQPFLRVPKPTIRTTILYTYKTLSPTRLWSSSRPTLASHPKNSLYQRTNCFDCYDDSFTGQPKTARGSVLKLRHSRSSARANGLLRSFSWRMLWKPSLRAASANA